jgi:hypothetical protein
MLEAKRYTLSELKEALIKESSEFKPVVGKNVTNDDAKNNVKAVDDIMKQAKDYNKSSNKKRHTNPELENDYNKTTLDVEFAYEPSQDYKDRVEAQAKGFASVTDEKNTSAKDNDSLDYEGNKNFYDANKKKNKEMNKAKETYKHAGLKSHNLPTETFKIKTPFKESKTMKRLVFKNTVFLNEENARKRVPEDYKTADNKFYMKDSIGNEYLVECTKDEKFDFVHTDVKLVTVSKKLVNEQFQRMKELTAYNSNEYMGNTSDAEIGEITEDITSMKKKLNEALKK